MGGSPHPGRAIRKGLALYVLASLLAGGVPLAPAQVQVDASCTVPAGTPIQWAVDAAEDGDVIVVCPGVYTESVVIRTGNLTLIGRDVVLDGTGLVGTQHGLVLGAGASGAKIVGFEVRNYRDPFASGDDPSSAIASFRGARGVTLREVWLHDNAWAGVFLVGGEGWSVERSAFAANGFAGIQAYGTRGLDVSNSSFEEGIVASQVIGLRVHWNSFRGEGKGAIIVTPGIASEERSREIDIQLNTIRGGYKHGIWALDAVQLVIQKNVIDTKGKGVDVTLGGARAGVVMRENTVGIVVESSAASEVKEAFKRGRPEKEDGVLSQALDAIVLPCVGLACLADVLDRLLPTASAQAPRTPLDALCDDEVACDIVNVTELIAYAVETGLNPRRDPTTLQDYERLRTCEGKGDACARAQFFAVDGVAPLAWTIPVPKSASVPAGQLVFLDAGVRRSGQSLASHAARGDLTEAWTTLVLCRFVVNGVPGPCNLAPIAFDYGLGIDWAEGDAAQHMSRWRLQLPSDVAHDTLDRIHARDATLFRFTAPARNASSPPPPVSPNGVPPQPDDPARVEAAGQAVLHCQIVVTPDGYAGKDPYASDCPLRALVREPVEPSMLWCASPLQDGARDVHESLLKEAPAAWAWSTSCEPAPAGASTTWTDLFEPGDLADLADAQLARADADAERIFERAVARRLALNLTGLGMPRSTDTSLISTALPTLSKRVSTPRVDTSAVWTGSKVVLFAGLEARDADLTDIRVYDPATDKIHTSATKFATPRHGTSAVWTGSVAYVFGGTTVRDGTLAGEIHRYEPTRELLTPMGARLPGSLSHAAAVWDGRDLPAIGCPAGCAYLFGGSAWDGGVETATDEIVRYNPTLDLVTVASSRLPAPAAGATACFDGHQAYVFGAAPGGVILRYDALSDELAALPQRLPVDLVDASCAFQNGLAYVVGGRTPTEAASSAIHTFDPASGAVSRHPLDLPVGVASGSTVATASGLVTLGGRRADGSMWGGIQRTPLTFDPAVEAALLAASKDFDAIPLEGGTAGANIRIESLRVADRALGWVPATIPALVAFTPMRLNVTFTYPAPSGDLVTGTFPVLVQDRAPDIAAASVEHAGTTLVDVVARDPDNLDVASRYADASARREHTVPLVTAAVGDATLLGLIDGTFALPLDTASFLGCTRQLWTAEADASGENLDGLDRLAVQDDAGAGSSCLEIALAPLLLGFRPPLVTTLEVRGGDAATATLVVSDDPLAQVADAPTPLERAVSPTSARIVVTIPKELSAAAKSSILASLLSAYANDIGVFAVEIDDLPLTPDLTAALETAAREKGTILLAGAGSLPALARADPPQEKLMTIHGLAASPLAITVGATDASGGVASWSRRGPTPTLGPKPDLVAASPTGTTGGAVANLLPFVEALVAQGVRDPGLVKAVLGAYAIPVKTEVGSVATYWDQGMGRVDLAAYVQMPGTDALLQTLSQRRGDASLDATKAHLATAIGTDAATIAASPADALFGLAALPQDLVREAVAATLLEIVLDLPALPAESVVDFGLVNFETEGAAGFTPLDYAPILPAIRNATRILLENAGYSGEDLDTRAAQVDALVRTHADQPQRVTLNVTHWSLFDLLTQGDYLFTSYRTLLDTERAQQLTFPTGASEESTMQLRDELTAWAFDATRTYNLADERTGYAAMSVETAGVPLVAVESTLALAQVAQEILDAEASILDGTSKAATAAGLASDAREDTAGTISSLARARHQGGAVREASAQLDLITQLQAHAEAMLELRREPFGNASLEDEIERTAIHLGYANGGIQRGETLVLDALVSTLERSARLLEDVLVQLYAPDVIAGPVTGLRELTTNVSQTRLAPVGPYVGLATMTSHDVTTYNPFTGEAVSKRDVTIPLPSLLWNNPTLQWRTLWRDTAPAAGQQVKLHSNNGQVFGSARVETAVTSDAEVAVYLGADHEKAYAPLLANLSSLTSGIEAELGQALDATLQDLEPGYRRILEAMNVSLRKDAVVTQRVAACKEATCTSEGWASTLDKLLSRIYSHPLGQNAISNATGGIPFRYLFPGSYGQFIPYPFSTVIQTDELYERAAPGEGAVEGSLDDPDQAIQRVVQGALDGLEPHPTAVESPEPDVTGVNSPDTVGTWVYEIDGQPSPAFHQFNLSVEGVDLLGVACLDVTVFGARTGTPLSFPGCNTPIEDARQQQELARLLDLARCALGATVEGLSATDELECQGAALELRQAAVECDANASRCGRQEALADVTEAIESYLEGLTQRSPARVMGTVPWVRSPARLASTRPGDYGLTTPELLPSTRVLNGLSETDTSRDAELRAAIEGVLGNLSALAREGTVLVDLPPKVSSYDHTLVNGVLHHSTDLVSGLDWTHVDPRRSIDATTDAQVLALLQEAAGLPIADAEAGLLAEYVAALTTHAAPSERLAAFSAGLAQPLVATADASLSGWKANGTATSEGIRVEGDRVATTIDGGEVCAKALRTSAVQASYLECGGIQGSTRGSVDRVGGTDVVQFTNALLERLRLRRADLQANEATTPSGKALRLGILREAASLSGGGSSGTWTRAEDGIRFNTTGPSVGVLLYSTPAPINEVAYVHAQGQGYMMNTGAFMITTMNPIATGAILRAVEASNLSRLVEEPTMDALERTITITRVIQAALDEQGIFDPQNDGDPLFRISLMGPGVVQQSPDATSGSQGGYRGFVATPGSGAFNFSTGMSFGTRGRGADFLGPDSVDVIIVYFPNVAIPSVPTGAPVDTRPVLEQVFALTNFSLRLETYSGLQASPLEYGVMHRLGYRFNVEDWKSFRAISREKVWGTTDDRGKEGLNLTLSTVRSTLTPAERLLNPSLGPETVTHATHVPTIDEIIQPWGRRIQTSRGNAVVAVALDRIPCPDSAAPGYTNETPFSPTTTSERDDELSGPQRTDCLGNGVDAGRPTHKTGSAPRNDTSMSMPRKRFVDALQYSFDMGEREDFTTARPRETCEENPCGRSLSTLAKPQELHGEPAAPDDPATRVARDSLLGSIDAQRGGAFGAAPPEAVESLRVSAPGERPVIALDGVRPFVEESVRWERQADRSEGPFGPYVLMHNYLVLTEEDARGLMPGDLVWLPNVTLLYGERMDPARIGDTEDDRDNVSHGQDLPELGVNSWRGGVAAYEVNVSAERASVKVLAGNGYTGSGYALDVTIHGPTTVAGKARIGPESVVNVTAYALGGNRTAGSSCADVPLHWYVGAYFRCTGYSRVQTYGTVTLDEVEALLAASQERRPARPADVLEAGEPTWWIQLALADAGATPPTLAPPTTPSAAAVQEDAAVTMSVAEAAAELMEEEDSRSSSPVFALGTLVPSVQNLSKAIDATLRANAPGGIAESLRNVTALLQPLHALYGEPPRLVVPTLRLIADGAEAVPAPTDPGFLRVLSTLEVEHSTQEWSTKLQGATLARRTTTADDVVSWETLATATSPGTARTPPLDWAEGASYRFVLNATDAHGNVLQDAKEVRVDNTPPLALEAPGNLKFIGQATSMATLSFQLADGASGLREARFERYSAGSWVAHGSPLTASQIASTGGIVSTTVDIPTNHGQTGGARVIATDWAGNVATSAPAYVTRDLAAPALSGWLPDARGQIVTVPLVRAVANASDSLSGIASWSAWLYDDATGARIDLAGGPGSGASVTAPGSAAGALGHRYFLNVSATDAAGNLAQRSVANATVRSWVDLESLIPAFQRQDTGTSVHFVVDASVLEFPDASPDRVDISVIAEPALKGTPPTFTASFAGQRGILQAWWNASATTPSGEYEVRITGMTGPSASYVTYQLNLTRETAGITPTTNASRSLLGALDSPTDSTVYRFTHPDCGSAFTLRLASLDDRYGDPQHDVDLYVRSGALDGDAARDPASYTVRLDSAATGHEHTWTGAVAGSVYQVLVTHKGASRSDYDLYFDANCSSGGGGDEGGLGEREPPPVVFTPIQTA